MLLFQSLHYRFHYRLQFLQGILLSLVDIINDKFPDLKGKIPVDEPGSDKSVIAESLATIDDTKSRELLGFEYYNLEQSVYDTVEQIVNAHKL